MDDLNFTSTIGDSLNAQTHLLIDVLAWQHIFAQLCVPLIAKETQKDSKEILKNLEAEKNEIRSKIIEEIYRDFGPDMKDLGLLK